MFEENKPVILSGMPSLDKYLLDLEADRRLGVSLMIPVSLDFSFIVNKLKFLEPGQYFYPSTDWHVTFQVIFTGSEQFDIQLFNIKKYIQILEPIFTNSCSFQINFQGFTLSNSAVLVQGFSKEIQDIRKKIREAIQKEGLIINERYYPQAAHATLMRFCRPLINPKAFIAAIDEIQETHFDKFEACCVKLNICDWYNQKAKRQELASFNLKPIGQRQYRQHNLQE